ncbi:MAG TPA: tRNA (adenosine(37)-N6)-threonylcarbamoyltransferase complex dimerization subunit type 1 TsaB [Candidatus Angelobacter sp.]|nr:tRNA (adenosine(37)-N6)-threonylcarbamoyltransferase complex dimerization subunit type 1 TsaB [Candidatus Angelobacter sp.]
MLILGIDTSGKSGGVSLAEAAAAEFRVLGSSAIAGGTFSAQLVPTVAALLEQNNRSVRQIDGFAVVSGPGSFTGLRVGLSAVKGLAEVLHKPIATISLLQAMAAGLRWAGKGTDTYPVCRVFLDASRGEVFFGEYECLQPVAPRMISESLVAVSELAEQVQTWGHSATLATPDAAVVEKLRVLVTDPALVSVSIVDRPNSVDIARIGVRKLMAGETLPAELLDANYLRRSDAELFFKGNR